MQKCVKIDKMGPVRGVDFDPFLAPISDPPEGGLWSLALGINMAPPSETPSELIRKQGQIAEMCTNVHKMCTNVSKCAFPNLQNGRFWSFWTQNGPFLDTLGRGDPEYA